MTSLNENSPTSWMDGLFRLTLRPTVTACVFRGPGSPCNRKEL
jgi:hypothetical protein